MKKLFTFPIALALAAPVMAEGLHIFRCSEDGIPGQTEPMLMGFAISADARYVCGTIQQGGGIFVADCLTGEVKWNADGEDSSELRAVDNRGVGVGFIDEDGVLFSFASGEPSYITAPEGVRYVQGEGISNDGSVMAGSFTMKSFSTVAAFSADGAPWTNLPMPSDEELGSLKAYINSFSAAKFVSGDGNVILGHLGNFTFPIVWKRNASGEYEADFFPIRYVKGVEEDRYDESKPLYALSGTYTCLSNNGRYAATVGAVADETNTYTRIVPVVYDIQEKSIKIYDAPQVIDQFEAGLFPRSIADDGTFIGTIGETAAEYNFGCFIWKAGEDQAELYTEAFPEFSKMLGEADVLGQNVPTGISADGQHIVGYAYYSKDYDITSEEPAYYVTYLISLDGSGVETSRLTPAEAPGAIYSIDGRSLSSLQKGLNIVRNADGSITKILK